MDGKSLLLVIAPFFFTYLIEVRGVVGGGGGKDIYPLVLKKSVWTYFQGTCLYEILIRKVSHAAFSSDNFLINI